MTLFKTKLSSEENLDAWVIFEHLYTAQNKEVRKYLIKNLYKISDDDVDFFLPQICTLLTVRDSELSFDLEVFLLYKCVQSIHFAIKCFWNLHAMEYYAALEKQRKRCHELRENLEMVVVNGQLNQHMLERIPHDIREYIDHETNLQDKKWQKLYLKHSKLKRQSYLFSQLQKMRNNNNEKEKEEDDISNDVDDVDDNDDDGNDVDDNHSNNNDNISDSNNSDDSDNNSNEELPPELLFLKKQRRCTYFNAEIDFAHFLEGIAAALEKCNSKQERVDLLKKNLEYGNNYLPKGLYIPISHNALSLHKSLLKICSNEVKCLDSKQKVPFLFHCQVVVHDYPTSSPLICEELTEVHDINNSNEHSRLYVLIDNHLHKTLSTNSNPIANILAKKKKDRQHNRSNDSKHKQYVISKDDNNIISKKNGNNSNNNISNNSLLLSSPPVSKSLSSSLNNSNSLQLSVESSYTNEDADFVEVTHEDYDGYNNNNNNNNNKNKKKRILFMNRNRDDSSNSTISYFTNRLKSKKSDEQSTTITTIKNSKSKNNSVSAPPSPPPPLATSSSRYKYKSPAIFSTNINVMSYSTLYFNHEKNNASFSSSSLKDKKLRKPRKKYTQKLSTKKEEKQQQQEEKKTQVINILNNNENKLILSLVANNNNNNNSNDNKLQPLTILERQQHNISLDAVDTPAPKKKDQLAEQNMKTHLQALMPFEPSNHKHIASKKSVDILKTTSSLPKQEQQEQEQQEQQEQHDNNHHTKIKKNSINSIDSLNSINSMNDNLNTPTPSNSSLSSFNLNISSNSTENDSRTKIKFKKFRIRKDKSSLYNKEEEQVTKNDNNNNNYYSTQWTDPFGESWEDKKKRICLQQQEKFDSKSLNWDLQAVIFKSGEDMRQENLAMQYIKLFDKIFKDARLPLQLRVYSVIVTSPASGFVEVVSNATSISNLKKSVKNFVSLRRFYEDYFGPEGTETFTQAQKNFAESLAAYSLVCYFLQIKDRHNGNILLDNKGRIIHIDFGFLLSNSPGGNINFENAPFKLTEEFIEILCGTDSSTNNEMFDYFRVLVLRGFIEARKHYRKFCLLTNIMLEGAPMPCFYNRAAIIDELKQRFLPHASQEKCIRHVMSLIEESACNWRTVQYDKFQRITNNIL